MMINVLHTSFYYVYISKSIQSPFILQSIPLIYSFYPSYFIIIIIIIMIINTISPSSSHHRDHHHQHRHHHIFIIVIFKLSSSSLSSSSLSSGTGGIKPNVSTMGADQFDERYSRDRKEKESFFNW